MDFFTWAILYVAATMQAVEAALRTYPELSARAPEFVRGKAWAFLPFVLLSLVGLIWLVQAVAPKTSPSLVRSESSTSQIIRTPASVAAFPSETPATALQAQSPIALSSPTAESTPSIALDPELRRLVGLFQGRTYFQAQELIKEKLGERTSVSGVVDEVYISQGGNASIVFGDSKRSLDLRIYMYFSKSWNQRLSALKKGDRISVKGKVLRVDSDTIVLDDCQVAEVANNK
jgi:hypothetical protein